MAAISRVVVTVPGSTSNIGPGYDCLGIALDLQNRVTVSLADVDDRGTPTICIPEHEMVADCSRAFFSSTGLDPFPISWQIEGDVPISRGLGSSVTLRLGILQGLNSLSGGRCTRDELFRICTELEGHPDNAGPAAYGGFFASNHAGAIFRLNVAPRLKFVLLIPKFEVLTDQARNCLPDSVPRLAAVKNVGNASAITAAFATGEYEKLRGSLDDGLHQPYRKHLVPGMDAVIEAGECAGALGGFLSGSGSAIACLSVGDDRETDRIETAMREALPDRRGAEIQTVTASNEGFEVLGES